MSRPHQPTHELAASGSSSAGRAEFEPEELLAAPEAPAWLDAYAKQEWDETVPVLMQMKVMTPGEKAVFASYCQAYSIWRRASEDLNRMMEEAAAKDGGRMSDGFIQVRERGSPHIAPVMTLIQETRKDLVKFAQLLGLSPSGRAAIGAGRARNAGKNRVKSKYGIQ